LAGLEEEIGACKGCGLEIRLKTRAGKNRLFLRKRNKAEDVEMRNWGQEDGLLSIFVFGTCIFVFYTDIYLPTIASRHAEFSCD